MTDLEQVQAILGRLCVHEIGSPELLWELIQACHPEVVLDTRYAIADGQLYHGRQGVESFFRDWLSSWARWSWTPTDVYGTFNGIVVLVQERAESFSGIRCRQKHVQNWVMEGGRVRRWTIYGDGYELLCEVEEEELIACSS